MTQKNLMKKTAYSTTTFRSIKFEKNIKDKGGSELRSNHACPVPKVREHLKKSINIVSKWKKPALSNLRAPQAPRFLQV